MDCRTAKLHAQRFRHTCLCRTCDESAKAVQLQAIRERGLALIFDFRVLGLGLGLGSAVREWFRLFVLEIGRVPEDSLISKP